MGLCAALTLWLAAGRARASNNTAPPAIVFDSVLVDGHPQQVPIRLPAAGTTEPAPGEKLETGRLRASSTVQRMEFRFGPNPLSSNPPVRLRYRLEGFDKEWREAGGEMRLNVRFLDAAGNTVSAQDFFAKGESVGWAGAVRRSRFDRRSERVKAPERAVRMQIELFSGGPEQTVGIMVIDDLSVSMASATNGNAEALLFSSRLEEGRDLDQPLAVPRGWMRDGSKPSAALLLRADDYKPLHVLAVVDTDPNTWGAWRTDPESSVPVHPGDTLLLQWNEMYSIGWGGRAQAEYSYLPTGQYQFRIQAVTETGDKTGEILSLPVTVAPPLWQTPWFGGGLLLLLVGALVAVVRNATWRKMQRQLELLNQQRAVELERSRIARDIHDDLGAHLTQIALLSELAQTDLGQPAQARAHLEQIFTTAGTVARQLDEIVWAITPTNDTLEEFASYTCKFAQDYLRVAGIRCRLEVPESLPKYPMSSAERHDLFLAAKEALHNVVKHAHADEVWLRLKIDNGTLSLEIQDNGKGLREPADPRPRGHGLANMQDRLRHVGGTFEQNGRAGSGTTVRLVLPLKK
ncbi:putative Integral membrane sensor signal transduction histidine kinase [Verrucomicrobia bacterium]|nr:putative Integral membrane sensor signal transduction histidine kinase [Verrucomicrobiota bacterium]